MPPGGDKLVRRLLEESVLRLTERFKAENEKKMQTMEQIDIVAPQEENKCEVVNLADEDEDSVARLEAEEVIEVSDEENYVFLAKVVSELRAIVKFEIMNFLTKTGFFSYFHI